MREVNKVLHYGVKRDRKQLILYSFEIIVFHQFSPVATPNIPEPDDNLIPKSGAREWGRQPDRQTDKFKT